MRNLVKILAMFISITAVCTMQACTSQSQETIKISGAFALYPMMSIWAEAYQKINPDIKIDVSGGGAGKGMADAIQGLVDIGMVSRDIYQSEIDQGIFWVSVTKDAVVATINSKNPALAAINAHGVTKEQFQGIFIARSLKQWNELENNAQHSDPIVVYTRSDACGAAKTWAKYLGKYNQDDLSNAANSAINGDPNLAAAVQGDVLGIGYNNINFVYDAASKKPLPGLLPVPIDLNANGTLDPEENFYATRDSMVKAIADGAYPSPPARNLHLVLLKTSSKATDDFIKWILTAGQKYVADGGYIELPEEVIKQQIAYMQNKTRPECP